MWCFLSKSPIWTTLQWGGWSTPAVQSWCSSFTAANTSTQPTGNVSWLLRISWNVLLYSCKPHQRIYTINQIEVSVGFMSSVTKISPLQITDKSSWKTSISHWWLKSPFLHKRRKYCNALVDTDPGVYMQAIHIPTKHNGTTCIFFAEFMTKSFKASKDAIRWPRCQKSSAHCRRHGFKSPKW